MSNIMLYEPFYDFERLFHQAEAARSNQLVANHPLSHSHGVWKPRMDLHEDNEQNLVTATFDLPGLHKGNVLLDVHNNRLTVSAQRHESEEFTDHGYAIRERHVGKFARTLQLPVGVKTEEIKAVMEHGVLTVTFPKTGQETPVAKVPVS